ncbi:MAG: extracellular solute-binding protein [Sphaerochaeta sp.]
MKKAVLTFLILLVVVSCIFAQGAKSTTVTAEAGIGKLVIYTTNFDEEYNLIVGGFEKKYPNIKIEAVTGGAGELKTRIKAEVENPQADVMFGGLIYSDFVNMGEFFETYVASNNKAFPAEMQNTTGKLTNGTIQVVNLFVNKAEAKKLGVTVTSYKDLLNPVLKGKIISANPAASSSAWNQLSTMLSSMGGYESKQAWDYIETLVKNLNGVMSSGSSGVYKGVFNGEYVVGITYESPCLTYIEDGYGDSVEIVYPVEGSNAITFASAIVKNAKDMDNAKLFMDWIASDEGQSLWATSTVRPANTNIPITNTVLTPTNKIKLSPRDNEYLASNQQAILDRWTDLWAKHN